MIISNMKKSYRKKFDKINFTLQAENDVDMILLPRIGADSLVNQDLLVVRKM